MPRRLWCRCRSIFYNFGNDNSPSLVYTPRTQSVLSVSTACTVATKALSDRVTVHRRKPRSIFQIGTAYRVCSFYQASACLSLTSLVPGDCLWPLSCCAHFLQTAGFSCLLQRRNFTTLKERPCSGTLDYAGLFPKRGKTASPLIRHRQVDWALCPMTVPRKRA